MLLFYFRNSVATNSIVAQWSSNCYLWVINRYVRYKCDWFSRIWTKKSLVKFSFWLRITEVRSERYRITVLGKTAILGDSCRARSVGVWAAHPHCSRCRHHDEWTGHPGVVMSPPCKLMKSRSSNVYVYLNLYNPNFFASFLHSLNSVKRKVCLLKLSSKAGLISKDLIKADRK